MTNTRDFVLKTLLERPDISIKDLAEAVDITPISVRHHIQKLHEGGLIVMKDIKQGVGRPKRVYKLSQKGMSTFPEGYISLSARLLKTLKASFSSEQIVTIFEEMAKNVISDKLVGIDIDKLTIEDRIHWLTEIFAEEGMGIEVNKTETGYQLIPLSCPYISLVGEFKEICNFDRTIVQTLLSGSAKKVESRAHGDARCIYETPMLIQFPTMEEAS